MKIPQTLLCTCWINEHAHDLLLFYMPTNGNSLDGSISNIISMATFPFTPGGRVLVVRRSTTGVAGAAGQSGPWESLHLVPSTSCMGLHAACRDA